MTKSGRIKAGIAVLIGGGLQFIFTYFFYVSWRLGEPLGMYSMILSAIMAIFGVLGGILLIVDKKVGAYLGFIAAAYLFIGFFFVSEGISPSTTTYRFAAHMFIDPILMVLGGIGGLVSGSEK